MSADPGSCLLVDLGNQRLKWRLQRAASDVVLERQPLPSATEGAVSIDSGGAPGSAEGDAELDFVRALEGVFTGMPAPRRALVSAVSHSGARDEFERWCLRRWRIAAEFVVSGTQFDGLVNGYDDPSQLGCDRWLAAIAAHRMICTEEGGDAVVVVDAGTAVTVDLVVRDRFAGGAILPGIATMMRVLDRGTGCIRLKTSTTVRGGTGVPADGLPSPLATNSDDAVHAGARHAVCGGVDRCIEGLRSLGETGKRVPVLITGGDARTVSAGIRHSGEVRSNLVLDGLALVAERQS